LINVDKKQKLTSTKQLHFISTEKVICHQSEKHH